MHSIPHKCPVCNGQGLVSRPPYIAGDQNEWFSSSAGPFTCHACGGSGIVWSVEGEEPEPLKEQEDE
jgi:DnaJ-class molecular chaperone